MRFHDAVLRLYPRDIRVIYGQEMRAAFLQKYAGARQRGRGPVLSLFFSELLSAVPDALAERIALLSSHPSLHGKCARNIGVIRPPGVGKQEWFYADAREPSKQADAIS